MGLLLIDSPITDSEFQIIQQMVYEQTGIKLGQQKKAMVQSRLMKRLKLLNCPNFGKYLKMVKTNPAERTVMFNLLTTNVTKFFRESSHFDFVCDKFLPRFLTGEGKKRPLRVWSAGCSTGQEPYSLAIVLTEYFNAHAGNGFEILASDINTAVLNKAREGIYSWEEVNEIPYDLLRKYFKLGTGINAGVFKAKDVLRQKVSFKYVNLADHQTDFPVGGKYDLIFCRNVFIYFDQETKGRTVKRFYDRLHPGGVLFLGHSESLNLNDAKLGTWSVKQHTVYQKGVPGE